ncbi:hypothetical protein GOBAR_AA03882 [Gossypium barbadense]|uniref:Uncharacterized protein n=1 Tax=Gossypium barbadense TaxID=3634 RepID=A0A2P5YM90_GOSBA|nr:hypothetical protein GOBAR_AA03882 [Gossypium barbadense]
MEAIQCQKQLMCYLLVGDQFLRCEQQQSFTAPFKLAFGLWRTRRVPREYEPTGYSICTWQKQPRQYVGSVNGLAIVGQFQGKEKYEWTATVARIASHENSRSRGLHCMIDTMEGPVCFPSSHERNRCILLPPHVDCQLIDLDPLYSFHLFILLYLGFSSSKFGENKLHKV